METVTLSRRELYDLAWAAPFSTLCKKYQISDVGLRKACVRLAIPLPGIGHWNKVHAGKKVEKKPFSPNKEVEQQIIIILATNEKDAGRDLPNELALLQAAIESDPKVNLVVKDTMQNPDPLITSAQKGLTQKDKYYREGNLVYAGSGQLHIAVTPALVNRALCFMDTFVKAMRERGHNFRVTDRECYVVLGNEEMEMNLNELQTRTAVHGKSYPQYGTNPNGKLALRFKRWGTTTEIKDGKTPIEGQLSKIIAKLEILGEKFRLEQIAWAKQRAIQEEERRKKEAFEARKKLEKSSFKQALKDAARWHETVQLRDYIKHIEQNEILSQERTLWLEWLKKKADWLDPTIESQDHWLTAADRDALLSATPEQPQSPFGYYNQPVTKEKYAWPLLPWYLKKE